MCPYLWARVRTDICFQLGSESRAWPVCTRRRSSWGQGSGWLQQRENESQSECVRPSLRSSFLEQGTAWGLGHFHVSRVLRLSPQKIEVPTFTSPLLVLSSCESMCS